MEEKEIIKSVLKEQKKQMPFGLMAVWAVMTLFSMIELSWNETEYIPLFLLW